MIVAAMITLEAPPPGYDVLWGTGVGAAIDCSGHLP